MKFCWYLVWRQRYTQSKFTGRHLAFFPLPVWSHSILICPIGKLDPENIGMAVGYSLISCLEAEIHAFEVLRPPSWITHFQFGCKVYELVSLKCWTPKTWVLPLEFRRYLVWERRYTQLKFTGRQLGISHLRFGRIVFQWVSMGSWTPKTYAYPLELRSYNVWKRRYMHLKFWGRHLGLLTSGLVAQYLN